MNGATTPTLVLGVLGALMVSPPLSAQPRPAQCRDSDRVIDRAIDARRRGDDAGALASFNALWQQCPSPRLRAQIGLAEEALHRWADAHQHLREALASSSDPWIASRRAPLEEVRARAASHLAGIAPEPAAPGTELWIGGRRVGELPLSEVYLMEPGTVEIEVRRAGQTLRRTLTLREGETFRERVDVVVAPPPSDVASSVAPPRRVDAAPASRGNGMRTAGIALAVTGGAFALGGVVLWVMSFSERERANDDVRWQTFYHRTLTPTPADAADACARAEGDAAQAPGADYVRDLCATNSRYGTLALAFGIGGAVVLGAGLTLTALAPRAPVRVSGSAGAGGGVATLTLTF